MWDNPTVKLTADDKGRITSSELFRPRRAYDASKLPDGTIRIVELVEKNVPVVRARKIGGRWIGADLKLDAKTIVGSIRADREE
jgi:hypothetical protein